MSTKRDAYKKWLLNNKDALKRCMLLRRQSLAQRATGLQRDIRLLDHLIRQV
jgi:hypothetical protein